jgi:hypothetical protein
MCPLSTEYGLNDGMIFLRRCFHNECFAYTFDSIARKIHGPNVIARFEKDFCLFKPLIRHTIELSRIGLAGVLISCVREFYSSKT